MSNTNEFTPSEYDLNVLEFKEAVQNVANYYYDHDDGTNDEFLQKGNALMSIADLIEQRDQFTIALILDDWDDSVDDEGEEAALKRYSERAKEDPQFRIAIGVLNHNTYMLKELREAYPKEFEQVWSIYTCYSLKVWSPDQPSLKKERLDVHIDITK